MRLATRSLVARKMDHLPFKGTSFDALDLVGWEVKRTLAGVLTEQCFWQIDATSQPHSRVRGLARVIRETDGTSRSSCCQPSYRPRLCRCKWEGLAMTPDLRTPPRATALVRIMERCTSSAHHPGSINLRRARALSVGECVTARTPEERELEGKLVPSVPAAV